MMCSFVGSGHISGVPAAFMYRVKASGPRSPTYTRYVPNFIALYHYNEKKGKKTTGKM
jgi:hypothetical protein